MVSYSTNEPVRNGRGQVTQKHLTETLADRSRTAQKTNHQTALACGKVLSVEKCGQVRSGRLGAPVRFSAPPRGAENGHPGQTPNIKGKNVSQKLQETNCTKCGQPITTTRNFTTQRWDLTPIPPAQAFWAALLRGPILAINQTGSTWRADLDRDHINIPTTRDQTTTWLPTHQCGLPPLPDAGPPLALNPPPPSELDLFNQPAPEPLPPY